LGRKKDAVEISKKISIFMQENKYTLSDITRGMVVLENLERDYVWGEVKTVKIKEKKNVEFAECTT
jgi:hypothetical protein